MDTLSFGEALERHYLWLQEHLPGVGTRQGRILLIWLLKHQGQARPIGDLYKAARASEPTMRGAVNAFVECGYAAIEISDSDARQRILRGTAKLKQKMQEYREQLIRLGEEA